MRKASTSFAGNSLSKKVIKERDESVGFQYSSSQPLTTQTTLNPLNIYNMSDTGRQSMTDKAGAALKPDSQKSTTEQLGDHLKGTGDSVASTFQPQSEKSNTQKIGDTFSSNSNNNDESLMDKAKNAVGMGEKK